MDPDANLKRQRLLRSKLLTQPDNARLEIFEELYELMEDMDDWLSNGGRTPYGWTSIDD